MELELSFVFWTFNAKTNSLAFCSLCAGLISFTQCHTGLISFVLGISFTQSYAGLINLAFGIKLV